MQRLEVSVAVRPLYGSLGVEGLIVVIIKVTDDDISPLLHNHINLINTNIHSNENLMMNAIGRNM